MISLVSFLLLSIGFAYINGSSDLFIVFKDSYYQWITVRLNETQQNTSILKNISDGLQILFINIKPAYQFGVLRIFYYPLLDHIVGFTFIVGLIISIIRRNVSDKLLILWTIIAFLITSVINVPQDRYFLLLFPTPYIYCAAILISIFNYGFLSKIKALRIYSFILLLFLIIFYGYFIGYHRYFISYADNNANMVHGLGDEEVSKFLLNNFDPKNTLLVTSIQLPGVELDTNFKFKNQILWSEFYKEVKKSKTNINQIINPNINNLILILSLNPNYKYYYNYDDFAKVMYSQAKSIFGNELDSNLSKKVLGNKAETIYEIYSIKVEDILKI